MQRILVIEDCIETQLLIQGLLDQCYQVRIASGASEAFQWIEKASFDLILLDIALTNGPKDGFSICAQIKKDPKTKNIPVMFLTSSNKIDDKVTGFSLGADDYIVKPFDLIEFRARVEAKLKSVSQLKSYGEVVWIGSIRFFLPFQKAFLVESGQETDLELTPNEFKLLYYLAKQEGHLFSREQLLSAIWGTHTHVIDRTVDAHIYTLRRKLAKKAQYIESVPGQGYRFCLA